MQCGLGHHIPQDFYLYIYHHKNLKSDVHYIHFALNYTNCRIQVTTHCTRSCADLVTWFTKARSWSLFTLFCCYVLPYVNIFLNVCFHSLLFSSLHINLLISFMTIIQWSKYPQNLLFKLLLVLLLWPSPPLPLLPTHKEICVLQHTCLMLWLKKIMSVTHPTDSDSTSNHSKNYSAFWEILHGRLEEIWLINGHEACETFWRNQMKV